MRVFFVIMCFSGLLGLFQSYFRLPTIHPALTFMLLAVTGFAGFVETSVDRDSD